MVVTRVQRVLAVIFGVNLLLVALKAWGGLRSGSLAVWGSVVDSVLDLLTTVVAWVVAGVAARAPDSEHPYGHAKFETLGALLIVGFLSVSVVELGRAALLRLARGGPPVPRPEMAALTLVVALGLGAGTAIFEVRQGRRLGSALLLADAAHLWADVAVSTTALLGVLLATRWPGADALAALAVAALIARVGWSIVREAVPVLVDAQAIDPQALARVAREVPEVRAVLEARSRGHPGQRYAELTIAVPGEWSVAEAHAIADAVEARLRERLRLQGVVVHVEPERPPVAAPPHR